MTNTEFIKRMIALTEELERAAAARPYDPDAYNNVIDRLNSITPPWRQRRRRRPWVSLIILIFLLLVLIYIVCEILYNFGIMDQL